MYRDLTGENPKNKKQESQCLDSLKSLKETADWLLGSYVFNIWNTYGALSRVCCILDGILSHGLHEKGPGKYWNFVCGLSRDKGDESPLISDLELNGKSKKDERMLTQNWLQQSLTDRSLTTQLQLLTQDESHVKEYYADYALLRNPNYTTALFVYLNAIEQNQPSLLEDFDLNLVINSNLPIRKPDKMIEVAVPTSCFNICDLKSPSNNASSSSHISSTKIGATESPSTHRKPIFVSSPKRLRSLNSRHRKKIINKKCESTLRKHNSLCSSTETISPPPSNETRLNIPLQRSASQSEVSTSTTNHIHRSKSFPEMTSNGCSFKSKPFKVLHKTDDFGGRELQTANADLEIACEATEVDCEISKSVAAVTTAETVWKAQHSRSRSDGTGVLNDRASTDDPHRIVEAILCTSMPSILPEQEYQPTKSILEGGMVFASTECFFPRPQPGQTLTSFLSSDFNICAELDRENAHFCISEALISAIEQIKCTETMKMAAEEIESDEEIQKLTQRIRIRRRERLQERAMKHSVLLSDGRTDTTTTSQSVSPLSSSHSSDFGTADSMGSDDEDVHDLELSDRNASNLKSMKESGLSLSMASMYSEADLHKGLFAQSNSEVVEKKSDMESTGVHMSAEAVALSLLKRFSEKQLPKASDLKWLVSEQDTHQSLLPLPDSWPIAPDAIYEEYDMEKTRLRGNLEWAPPRQQIIFIIHPEPKRKEAILKQNYRCAGCGMKIERSYIKKFRYCEYLGKFFCHCCHANNVAYIPSKILWKWDFQQYYVSKFSWKLLDQMLCDPLFNVMDVNPKLYRKIRQLDLCREYRLQMFYLKSFIKTCRSCDQIQKELDQLSPHIYSEPHMYSINDFLKVKQGVLTKLLCSLVAKSTGHVIQCILCRAKGFICEMCNNFEDIIFPFQLTKVCRCDTCGSCFHKHCHKVGVCPKCIRKQERKRKQELKSATLSDDEL